MSTLSKGRLLAGGICVVLTGCVSQSKYDALLAENMQLQQQVAAQSAQRTADEAAIAEGEGRISRLQGAIKYTVESDLLFEPGSWELSEAGKKTMAKLASKLAPTQQNKLVVNGYTDVVPVGPRLEEQGVSSNQELSQKRAEAVRDFLIARGVDPSLVTAVGHGAANPVAANDTAQGRSKNRRVELSLGG
jgi:outer membrane protein OmpA-like peptidoglycan-associated protein